MSCKPILLQLAMALFGVIGALREAASDDQTNGTNNELCFYVAPGGIDRWSGTRFAANHENTDGPFATLSRARDAIRELKSAGPLTRPVTIMVLDGTYFLDRPLELTGADSGTVEHPIKLMAYPGHHPVLSGGRRIVDWTTHEGKIIRAVLPEVKAASWNFRQLYCNGKPQIRARWPNREPDDPLYGGWAFIEKIDTPPDENTARFIFGPESSPRRWSKPTQAEVNIFPWYCWVNDIVPVAQLNADKRTIILGRRPQHPPVDGNRFIVENVLEELDQPGEWCLDREAGMAYFWPSLTNSNPDVIAPRIDTLIQLTGTADQPVRHITVAGLTLEHTNSPFPEQQHAVFHSPTLNGAAIRLENCEDCCVRDCDFRHLGGDGVRLHGANARNRIIGNEIAHVGGAGISLVSHQSANVGTWADREALRNMARKYPKLVRNEITNNHIHHCGTVKKNGGGVQFYGINSVDNRIAHNLIHDMSDKGMTMQDGFGRFVVEYNDIHTIGLEIADTGGIMTNRWFTLEEDPELADGVVIRFNRIRDCVGCGAYAEQLGLKAEGAGTKAGGRIWSPYFCWGIYFDNSAIDVTVFGNIVESTVLGAISMPTGSPKNNHVENNIFINGRGNQLDLRMDTAACNNRFVRNIVSYTNRNAMLLAAQPEATQYVAECDHNLYHPASGQKPMVRGIGSFEDWQKLGFDQHSVFADPLFVNAASGDYRMLPESPALKLGFRQIDLSEIGLREPYRTTLPSKMETTGVIAK